MVKFYLLTTGLVFLCVVASLAQLPAFPTAEGAGRFTSGGRGTVAAAPVVYEVTNLSDVNTAGSFRYACTNGSAARIIVFRIAGTIRLSSALTIKANTTVAGQTAPGEGICIADYPVLAGGNNIIVRYLRFRLGDKNQAATLGGDDAFSDNGNGRSNIIIDHCSMSWSNDEAFTFYGGDNITLQWNFITEPLDKSYHNEGSGVQTHAYGGIWGGRHASFHHNLMAHCRGRMPRFDGIRNNTGDSADFRNNILYNWADYNTNGGEGGAYNIVNNYYKYGPSTPSTSTAGVNRRNMLINPYKQTTPAIAYGKYFLTGNYCDNSTAITANNWLGAAFNSGSLADSTNSKVTSAFTSTPSIATETALQAYQSVLAKAGCVLPRRDTLDERIVNDVLNRTGKLIDCQGGYAGFPGYTPFATSQSAWPVLTSGTAQTDTDHDGMPDNWELQRGLNPNNAADRNDYVSTSGYNNLENYINGDTIVAAGKTNTCVTAQGISCTGSGAWRFADDTSYSYYLSPDYTAATDSNQVVAAILDNASYGSFSVSYYTTSSNRNDVFGWPYARRNITITPGNPALIAQPVTVRLYISQAEFNALKTADPTINTIADLVVLKASDNNCITALPASFTAIVPQAAGTFGTYGNGYYVEFQTSSFSTFFFQGKASPVPVVLSAFTVKKTDEQQALIHWQTAQETNSKTFLVQRKQAAADWQTIATVNAAGNSNIPVDYTVADNSSKKGIYYYRLLQYDLDGKVAVSATRQLQFGRQHLLVQVYPNPAAGSLQVQCNETPFYITIMDMTGRAVLRQAGANTALINTATFANGSYLLLVQTATEKSITKIIVRH